MISSGTCSGYVVENTIAIKVSALGVNAGITKDNGISLLPNPSKGEFTVKGALAPDDNTEVTMEVTDVLGQVIYSRKVMAAGGNINEKISLDGALTNGMYMLNIRSMGENKVFHFVIEK